MVRRNEHATAGDGHSTSSHVYADGSASGSEILRGGSKGTNKHVIANCGPAGGMLAWVVWTPSAGVSLEYVVRGFVLVLVPVRIVVVGV